MCESALKVDASVDASLDQAAVQKAIGKKLEPDLEEALVLGDQISPVLATGLMGNPRQCKRFLNTLLMRLSMAGAKDVKLKKRVLAKLMLLEYMKPESFKELARLQAAQLGKPGELAALERQTEAAEKQSLGGKSVDDKAVKPKVELPGPGSLTAWSADEWLGPWVRSEPTLAAEDLRPYFYFAREKLDPLVGVTLRMSPEAQNALAKLLGPTVAERSLVLSRAALMSPADAAAIFEAMTRRARETETLSMTEGTLPRLADFVDARSDLFGEFIAFLKSLPDARIPFGLPARIAMVASTPERKQLAIPLLSQWRTSGGGQLKKTATSALETLAK